jgi:hypothetical protein
MMSEWHIPFDHIETNWTCAQIEVMWKRLCERKKKEADEIKAIKDKANNGKRHTSR